MFRHSGRTLVQCLRRPVADPFAQCSRLASVHKRNSTPFVSPSQLSQRQLQAKLAENRALSADEWRTLRSDLLAADDRSITAVNIDATILAGCLPDGRLEAGKSYVRFLRESGDEPNLASLGRLLRLYHMAEGQGRLSLDDRQDIVQIIRDLQQQSSTYDSNTTEHMLHAILATDAWRDAIDMLQSIKLTAKPSTSAYSLLAARAFGDNEAATGWRVLHECLAAERVPRCEVFVAYARWCERHVPAEGERRLAELTKMLQLIGAHGLVISRLAADALARAFATAGWRSEVVHIDDKGHCPSCRVQLRSVFLTNQEFKQISSVFLERVLVRHDVFVKSSPAEVAKFERFLQSQPPFDCVIDGLNVAYSTGNAKPPAYYGRLLSAVVRFFVKQRRRVLVLGRRHMLKWPNMGAVQQQAKVFLTDDLSQDDPFLLYATLKSGPGTDFVSRDLMRGHAHLLGADLKPIFRRWQQEHQYCLDAGSSAHSVHIREPIKFQTNAHTAGGTWHVPFTDAYSASPADTFAVPPSWLCIVPASPN